MLAGEGLFGAMRMRWTLRHQGSFRRIGAYKFGLESLGKFREISEISKQKIKKASENIKLRKNQIPSAPPDPQGPARIFFVAVSSKTVHGFCGHFRVNLKSIWVSVACKPRSPTGSLLRAKNTPTFSFLPQGED